MPASNKTIRSKHPIAVAVDVVLFVFRSATLQVLLIQRRNPPFQGQWAFPGGFVEPNESLEAAASRELREETGLVEVPLEQLHTFGEPDRDPRMRVMSVAYLALASSTRTDPHAGDDAAKVGWYPVDSLPSLAFDHADMLECALEHLRTRLRETAPFQLLPAEFTLPELQAVYEAISGESVDKRNFQRKIRQVNRVYETGRFRTGEGRPARLYRYRGTP